MVKNQREKEDVIRLLELTHQQVDDTVTETNRLYTRLLKQTRE